MKGLKVLDKCPGVQHIKVGTYRKGKHQTATGWSSRSVYILNAFIDSTGISFKSSFKYGNDNTFVPHYQYRLSLKTARSGERKFTFYFIRNNKVRIVNPLHFQRAIEICLRTPGIPKSHIRRLNQIIRFFCAEQKYLTTGLSSDPFELMLQLCYPAARQIDKSLLKQISVGRYLLGDPVKLVLNTRGRTSKKLIMQTIKKSPDGIQTLFRIAHYLRTTRSLDAAQTYLRAFINESSSYIYRYGTPNDYVSTLQVPQPLEDNEYPVFKQMSFSQLSTKHLRILDSIPPDVLGKSMNDSSHTLRDTFNMYLKILHIGITDIENPGNTLNAVHNYMTQELLNADRQLVKLPRPPIVFNQEQANMVIAQAMCDQYNTLNTGLVAAIPYGKESLTQMGNEMHNCATSYAHSIKANAYIIVVFKEDDKCKYMLGFNFRHIRKDKYRVELEQAVTYCNRPIDNINEGPNHTTDNIFNALTKDLGHTYEDYVEFVNTLKPSELYPLGFQELV
jgi:hypothetical protein